MVLVWATMCDGTVLSDLAQDFAGFTAAVLSFRRDPDVTEVRWTVRVPIAAAARLEGAA